MAASPSEGGPRVTAGERVRPAGAWGKPTLRHLLRETDRFVIAAELITSRGLITETHGRRILTLARELAEHPGIDALSITDNPGGKT